MWWMVNLLLSSFSLNQQADLYLARDKRTFVVSHLEDADEATSSRQGSSKITTPTKGAEVYNPSDFVTPSKPSSSQFPSQTPSIDIPHQEHHSTILETPTGVKESAISLDDILEDGLQMPQRKVKRPLVFESDDEHDEQHSKKLTRLWCHGESAVTPTPSPLFGWILSHFYIDDSHFP
ncbi:hypothetical protein ACFE04_015105 [Oxalis oulophora]